jgi:hypothetical protein
MTETIRYLPGFAALFFFAATLPADAQRRNCAQLREAYEKAVPPKAWAVSADGFCGSASRQSANTLEQAKARAIEYCAAAGGKNCKVMGSVAR